jgi:hypothetical protein
MVDLGTSGILGRHSVDGLGGVERDPGKAARRARQSAPEPTRTQTPDGASGSSDATRRAGRAVVLYLRKSPLDGVPRTVST